MWAQIAAALVGLWTMVSPGVLSYGKPAAASAWIAGPLIASLATVSVWEATRGVRWANLAAGAWLIMAPIFIDHPMEAAVSSVLSGIAVCALTPITGRIKQRFGGGWRALWQTKRLAGAGE